MKGQGILQGAFWLGSSSVLQSVLKILFYAILARLLTPADFGLMALATMVIGFAELFSQMGVGPALVQRQDIDEKHINTAFSFSVILGVFLYLIFLLINPFLASFFGMPQLREILNFLAVLFPVTMISQVSFSLIQKELRFKTLAGLDVITFILGYGIVGIGLALLDFGVWALVYASLTQGVSISILYYIRHKYRFKIEWSNVKLLQLLNFGAGFTLARFFNYLALKGDYFIVGKFLGDQQLGYYSRAYGLMNSSNTILGRIMNIVLFAKLSSIQGRTDRMRVIIIRGQVLILSFFLPAGIVSAILAPEIIYILLGPQWESSIIPFQILSCAMVLRVGYKLGGTVLRSLGKVYHQAIVQFLYAVLVIFGSYIGLKWGIIGVAIGVSLALMFSYFFLTYYASKFTGLNWDAIFEGLFKGLALSLIFGIVSYLLANQMRSMDINAIGLLIILGIVLGSLLFILILWKNPLVYNEHTKEYIIMAISTLRKNVDKIFKR